MRTKKFLISLLAILLIAVNLSALATDWVAMVTGKTKVYASANKSSKVLGTVSKYQLLWLEEVKDGWAKVSLDGKVGYMSSSYIRKTTKDAYVKVAEVKVYAKNSSSSKVLGTYSFGEKFKVEAVSGSWARLVNGKTVGFCKTSALTYENPNTMKSSVYTQKDGVKAYEAPTSSSDVLGTLKLNTKVTCLAIYNDSWCRVQYGSKIGFIRKSELATTKYSSSSSSKNNDVSTEEKATGNVVEADWWTSSIQRRFARGETAVVTDVATGITFRVYRGGGTNHADVQPYTAKDTAAMKKACGKDFGTWKRRAIWVTVDGVNYAASMNCMPHGDGSITSNDFDGHFCIHFTNSRTHGTNKVDPDHQAAIKKALRAGN
ncbi:MAG: hypothetical protein IJN21_02740 [Clostridia bacterium]|nr:hypothetical protein [Clostridiales bacterium]MBQ6715419.1 hypothetical protein [Clostridia bacterium]